MCQESIPLHKSQILLQYVQYFTHLPCLLSFCFSPSCFCPQVDGDLYLTDEPKEDCLREVQAFLSRGVSLHNLEIQITYYLTSIYGEICMVEIEFRRLNYGVAFVVQHFLSIFSPPILLVLIFFHRGVFFVCFACFAA